MKKMLFGLMLTTALVACKNNEEKVVTTEPAKTDSIQHLYKPSYTDNWKIGDQKNVLLAEELHKYVLAKDFKGIGNFIADTASLWNDDGTIIKGKEAIMKFMEKSFSAVTLKNYNLAAIFPVVGANGHQWVDIWDEADVVTPDGKSQKVQWQDAIRFENGKIVHMIEFTKMVK